MTTIDASCMLLEEETLTLLPPGSGPECLILGALYPGLKRYWGER